MSSVSIENYLKCIHHLQQEGSARVKNKEIADRLGLTLPSVTSMLQALAAQELLDYVPYQGVLLTPAGERAALKVLRKHRLIEVFLSETLQMNWDEIHEEAELLEHSLSDRLTERIAEFLGHPRFDPHGDPIPSPEGVMPEEPQGRPLAHAPEGTRARITRVLDQAPEVLRYLEEQGLIPGTAVQVQKVGPFEGPVTVLVDGPPGSAQAVSLSHELSHRILVHEGSRP